MVHLLMPKVQITANYDTPEFTIVAMCLKHSWHFYFCSHTFFFFSWHQRSQLLPPPTEGFQLHLLFEEVSFHIIYPLIMSLLKEKVAVLIKAFLFCGWCSSSAKCPKINWPLFPQYASLIMNTALARQGSVFSGLIGCHLIYLALDDRAIMLFLNRWIHVILSHLKGKIRHTGSPIVRRTRYRNLFVHFWALSGLTDSDTRRTQTCKHSIQYVHMLANRLLVVYLILQENSFIQTSIAQYFLHIFPSYI